MAILYGIKGDRLGGVDRLGRELRYVAQMKTALFQALAQLCNYENRTETRGNQLIYRVQQDHECDWSSVLFSIGVRNESSAGISD
jgi:hypothetical protein